MQSVLAILSPSSLSAKAVAGPVSGFETDPCGWFSRLLAEAGTPSEDEETAGSTPAVEGAVAAAILVPLWAGAVAMGADGPGPSEAAVPIEAVSRFGMLDAHPASEVPTDAALPWGIGTPVQPAPVQPEGSDPGGKSEAIQLADKWALSDGTGSVAILVGSRDQATDAPDAHADVPGGTATRQAWGMAAPVSQPALPAVTSRTPRFGLDCDPVDVSGHGSAGLIGTHPADTVTDGANRIDEVQRNGPVGADVGLAVPDPNAPANLGAQTDSKAKFREDISAAQPEVKKVGTGIPSGEGMPTTAEVMDELASAPERAVQRSARAGEGGAPQAGFWERLLSRMDDAKPPSKTADDTAEPDLDIRPEHRRLALQIANTSSPLPTVPVGAAPAKPEDVDVGVREPAIMTDVQPALTADPATPDLGRPVSGSVHGFATETSGPHTTAEPGATEHGPPSAADLRDTVAVLDPMRESFGDPARLAVSGAPPIALPVASVPAASPVPMPQLAAQMTAALISRTEDETELALSPGELGHVRVKLKPDAANPDRLVVMLTFERPETLDLFRRHAGELADAFRAAGYAGADLGFGQQGSGQPDPRGHVTTQSYDEVPLADPPGVFQPSSRHSGAASLDLRL